MAAVFIYLAWNWMKAAVLPIKDKSNGPLKAHNFNGKPKNIFQKIKKTWAEGQNVD